MKNLSHLVTSHQVPINKKIIQKIAVTGGGVFRPTAPPTGYYSMPNDFP